MANSNLTPEKRVDKRGIAVTRHVKTAASPTAGKVMPAPSLNGASVTAKPAPLGVEEKRIAMRVKELGRNRIRRITRSELPVHANSVLHSLYKESYTVRGNDNDFYSLVEKLHPDDAVVLSHHGLKPDQLDAFILSNNYQFYLRDNTELVAELRKRGIPAMDFIRAHCLRYDEGGEDVMIDAAECSAIYAASKYGDKYGARDVLSRYVGQETVALEDIKTLGPEHVAEHIADFSRLLLRIKRGSSLATAQEIKDMIGRTGDDKSEESVRSVIRTRTAVRYGVEFAEGLRFPHLTFHAEEIADKLPVEDAKSFLTYVDNAYTEEPSRVWSGNAPQIDMEPCRELWSEGIDVEVAREGLERGFSAREIIAIEKEGIMPAVADGWL
jgi:hypothetical protein